MTSSIYLDSASSTPLNLQVRQILLSTLDYYGNPSSLHQKGVDANNLIQLAKDKISKKLNSSSDELFFTSGATMSNNQAIQGFLKAHPNADIITSCIEHDDIYLMLQNYPYDLKHYIPCDNNGYLDIDCLTLQLDELQKEERTTLLSIQWANNEMGVIQDMKAICDLANSYPNVYIHSDATQYIPYYSIDVGELGIDMLSCSSQKIGGLKGTGLLYVREGIQLKPIIYGDQGLIGGTENVLGIVCIGEAFNQLDYSKDRIQSLKEKRNYIYEQLKDDFKLVGELNNRLPNNICLVHEEIRGEQMVALLSDMGVYISSGSACNSHTNKASRTLISLGYSEDLANSSIRITIGDDVTYNDLDKAAKYIKAALNILIN